MVLQLHTLKYHSSILAHTYTLARTQRETHMVENIWHTLAHKYSPKRLHFSQTYTHTCVLTYLNTQTCAYTCVQRTNAHILTHAYQIHIMIPIHTHMITNMRMHTQISTNIHIHIQAGTHKHTYTQAKFTQSTSTCVRQHASLISAFYLRSLFADHKCRDLAMSGVRVHCANAALVLLWCFANAALVLR